MTEEWKPVVGYEGYYEVSSLGRVRSVERLVVRKTGQRVVFPGVVLSTFLSPNGRIQVSLWKGNRMKNPQVHRLVAMAFLPNPDNLPEVNHKDENPQNNRVENLEWCTKKYNMNYGTRVERMVQKLWVPVVGIDKDGNEYRFASMLEAAEKTGARKQEISNICRGCGRAKRSGGYRWRYAEKTS